ncbi:hypothetical protein EYF80_043694 [Liparis tanakae]|uniref:Uncharacterized protein n=1 Tax=Liparis tanakae TaxID=230148 RepID=A0A4Z2FXY8_9TELE|nr:hypothetical protein EYF80_043694 [Liparis tanakae]
MNETITAGRGQSGQEEEAPPQGKGAGCTLRLSNDGRRGEEEAAAHSDSGQQLLAGGTAAATSAARWLAAVLLDRLSSTGDPPLRSCVVPKDDKEVDGVVKKPRNLQDKGHGMPYGLDNGPFWWTLQSGENPTEQ